MDVQDASKSTLIGRQLIFYLLDGTECYGFVRVWGVRHVRVESAAGQRNGAAGRITDTSTTERQIQLALKIMF